MDGTRNDNSVIAQAALLATAACFLFAAAAQAQIPKSKSSTPKTSIDTTDGAIPQAPTHYMGREIAQTMHYLGAPWLVRESRQREEECTKLLEALKIKPGQTVCDMGCGNGFYTLELSKLVGPEGRVIAVDIQQEMLRMLEERAKEAGIKNITPILGTPVDPQLPQGEVDLILCVDVYHEFSHPEQMLAAMRKSLGPGGRLVLVEFRAEDPKVPIKPLHKMSKKQILKELTANGYQLAEQFDKLPWQHVMFFEKISKKSDKTVENAGTPN